MTYELIRPLDLYNNWFARNLAMRTARTMLRCFPTLLIALLIPAPYGLSITRQFPLFLVTFILSVLLVISFVMLIYIANFYLLSPTGIRMLVMTIGEFLTGAIIPLPFLPNSLQDFIELTPFGAMQNIPLRVYSGDLSSWIIVLPQLFWLIILVALGQSMMKNALKRVVIQGG